AVEVEGPGVVGASEAALPAAGAVLALALQQHARRVRGAAAAVVADQPPPAVRADVVKRPDRIGRGADDQDRIVGDVVGDVAADLGDLLDPAGLLPDLRPEPLG